LATWDGIFGLWGVIEGCLFVINKATTHGKRLSSGILTNMIVTGVDI
jgi:hypothetical protein